MKTIFKKDGQEVVLSECYTIIKGKLKTFCIEEIGAYFESEKRGIRAANDLLLKKTLSKYRYNEKVKEKRKRIGARKIIFLQKGLNDTMLYVKKWDGILYLETKKGLVKELSDKIKDACEKYEFSNSAAAFGFMQRLNDKNDKKTKDENDN